MLQFYFDFIDKYVSNYQYCEMDTDSGYIALAGPSIDSLMKEELGEEYENVKRNWFPRTDTPQNKAYDKRTPGLFKVEWEGKQIIGLCSRTFIKWSTRNVMKLKRKSI